MKCEKFTDDRQQTTDNGRQVMAIVHLDQGSGELKRNKTTDANNYIFIIKFKPNFQTFIEGSIINLLNTMQVLKHLQWVDQLQENII